jgi:bifunctional non-homologous end joining protein LigD
MPKRASTRDTSIRSYRAKRDFAITAEPTPVAPDRRLAAHVEDHPLEYAEFQGSIPEDQYGAGTVETWDRGTWTPIGDPEAGMRKGDLQFVLHGQRLRGRFHLVRLKRRERERQEAWYLIKGHDEYERPGEPRRVCRRPVILSQAAKAVSRNSA